MTPAQTGAIADRWGSWLFAICHVATMPSTQMLCEKCGQSLGEDVRSCSRCGAAVVTPALPYADTVADRMSEDRPIYVLRPTFTGWGAMLSVLPGQLFMTIWIGVLGGWLSTVAGKGLSSMALGRVLHSWIPFVFFASLAFFGTPLVAYFGTKRSYARTEYRFYRDRVEYCQCFIGTEQRTIPYSNVLGVELKKGIVQRQYNLGTIVLHIQAETFWRKGWRYDKVEMVNIAAPDDVYETAQELVRQAQTR